MAAHGLTIMRQIQKMFREGLPSDQITHHVNGALSAPGTCFTRGFSMDSWGEVEQANTRLAFTGSPQALAGLQSAVEGAIKSHMWMDAYPTMESVAEAMAIHIKYGKPHYKSRERRFLSGDADTHRQAREAVAGRWPLERRAPSLD